MLEKTMMYNFEMKYRPGKEMAVADWGSRSPCQEGAHEDFITKNNKMGITGKSLRVKQLDLIDPKLEELAAIGAEDQDYQLMIGHSEIGIQEDFLEENSELLNLKGDLPHVGQESAS